MTRSVHHELLERHRQVLPSWIALYYEEPIQLVSGSGRHVTDADGRTYLDFFAGILTTSIGHDIPEFTAAVERQLHRVVHTSTLYLIEQQIQLAERLGELSGIPGAKTFFVNSGSEANDAALLLSAIHRQSNNVMALEHGYHGRSFGSGGVTEIPSWSATGYSPVRTGYAPSGYKYRSEFADRSDEAFVRSRLDGFHSAADAFGGEPVACLLVEPIQGVGGYIVPPTGLIAAYAGAAADRGILFVSDEVQTGLGRTGTHFFGISHEGVTPDLITFAKGMANGLPIGGVIGRPGLIDAITANSISTFGGNPLVMAGALATLDYVEAHGLVARAAQTGGALIDGIRQAAADHPGVGDVRGRGLMLAIEFVRPGSTDPDPGAAARFLEAARERGVLVGKGGAHGNAIRIAPPLSVTAEEIADGVDRLADALDD